MKLRKGFTLIELLVVIAIIGILAAMVLVALNSARQKAKDARIQGDISQLRSAAEVQYDSTSAYTGFLTAGTAPTLTADVTTQGGSVQSVISATAYSIASALNGGGYQCADSTGVSKSYTTAIPSPWVATACP